MYNLTHAHIVPQDTGPQSQQKTYLSLCVLKQVASSRGRAENILYEL